ncbi:hypothetical protein DPMN_152680 [Dreissena polymorpha]|uniref:Uncharacterized protein n=1 Tax=Dreissena polymorpha TaxID=45954 RepID=A0A9D4FIR5_DREPO|nr:hypothetical protein DPMN_152680 [Dreissena polymorpha]
MSRVVGRITGRDVCCEVEEANGRETLHRAWDHELGTMLPLDHERVERAVEGNVSLARQKGRHVVFSRG